MRAQPSVIGLSRWNAGEVSDSFSMVKMAPQVPGLNQWERLEEATRVWAWAHGNILIYVGPILWPTERTLRLTMRRCR
jgi:DNA/RNA endonuclease G (NUC1)